MSARRSFLAGVAGASLVLAGLAASGHASNTVQAPSAIQALDVPGTVHFTVSGDFSQSSAAASVLAQIGSIDPNLHLALGDLSYGAVGAEQPWCDFVTSRSGQDSPSSS
jgi:hypothetical protein